MFSRLSATRNIFQPLFAVIDFEFYTCAVNNTLKNHVKILIVDFSPFSSLEFALHKT